MTIRIAHVNLRIKDPENSLEFYKELGLKQTGRLNLGPGYYLLYLSSVIDEETTIELTVNEGAGADYDRSPGSGHFALAVGDLDQLFARLVEAGIQPESSPFHPAGREDLRICFVADPDGHRIELIEGDFPTPNDAEPVE